MKSLSSAATLCLSLLAILSFSHCKKKNNKRNIVLYNQPLSVIREHIQGKWQLLYRKRGIATTTKYSQNNFWEFNNDRIRISTNDIASIDTTIRWVYGHGDHTNGDFTYVMYFNNRLGYYINYVVDQIYNDTLILHANAADAFFYRLVKSN